MEDFWRSLRPAGPDLAKGWIAASFFMRRVSAGASSVAFYLGWGRVYMNRRHDLQQNKQPTKRCRRRRKMQEYFRWLCRSCLFTIVVTPFAASQNHRAFPKPFACSSTTICFQHGSIRWHRRETIISHTVQQCREVIRPWAWLSVAPLVPA